MEDDEIDNVILLVHGTFDGDASIEGSRWWQEGGLFSAKLNSFIATSSSRVAIKRFQWSGLNLESARRSAAKALSDKLRELAYPNRKLTVLTHSHGGNVVRRALQHLSKESPDRVDIRVVSVATPFFNYGDPASLPPLTQPIRRRLTTWAMSLIGISPALLALAWIVALFYAMNALANANGFDLWWLALAVLVSVSIMVALPAGIAASVFLISRWFGLLEAQRIHSWHAPEGTRWESIYSNNDEAMILLNWVAKPRPIFGHFLKRSEQEKEAISLSPDRFSQVIGRVSLVAIGALAGLTPTATSAATSAWFSFLAGYVQFSPVVADAIRSVGNPFAIGAIILFGPALLLIGLYYVGRLCFRALTLVFLIAAKPFELSVRLPIALLHITLRLLGSYGTRGIGAGVDLIDGVVFKRISSHVLGDDCAARITGVSKVPWPELSACVPLPEEMHLILETHVSAHMGNTGAALRRHLGAADDVLDDRDWGALTKVMTWSELAHTAYFRAPEVCDFIISRLTQECIDHPASSPASCA